jgi:hypothetical protein
MAADAHAFRAQYDATLRQLQFNSKPLIDALTLMAESNPHFAGVVVDAIRDRATRVGLYGCSALLCSAGRMGTAVCDCAFPWAVCCVVSETITGWDKGLWPGLTRELDSVLGQPAMQRCGFYYGC